MHRKYRTSQESYRRGQSLYDQYDYRSLQLHGHRGSSDYRVMTHSRVLLLHTVMKTSVTITEHYSKQLLQSMH